MQSPWISSLKPISLNLFAAGLLAILACNSTIALAAETESSAKECDADKLQGQVIHIEKAGTSGDSQQDKTFSSLSPQGIGNGMNVPVSEQKGIAEPKGVAEQKGAVEKTEGATELKEDKAELDMPAAGKKMTGKAEEAVTKGEIGVDWSVWIRTLADRWFMNLKNIEYRSGRAYKTTRPALIKFTCHRGGQISGIALYQSCGVPAYDKIQIEALKRVMPLPPFPEGSRRVTYTLLQGWAAHPRKPGEQGFKLGSYGKDFPVEKVTIKHKIR